MWHVGSKTAPGNVANTRTAHCAVCRLFICDSQWGLCDSSECGASLRSELVVCLSLVPLSLSVFQCLRDTVFLLGPPCRARYSVIFLFCTAKFAVFLCIQKKVFCISVSHWQCIAMWVVCILQCHITNVTDKVQIAVIAVLLLARILEFLQKPPHFGVLLCKNYII